MLLRDHIVTHDQYDTLMIGTICHQVEEIMGSEPPSTRTSFLRSGRDHLMWQSEEGKTIWITLTDGVVSSIEWEGE